MNCEQAREALSARVDSEAEGFAGDRVDRHLSGCAGCRDWFAAARQLHRRIRVRPAVSVPDLTAQILAAADLDAGSPPRTRRRVPVRRWSLAGLAAIQLGVAMVEQFGPHHGDGAAADAAHLFHEGTAWNLALGVGFAAAAVRPRLAAGLLPALAAFVAVLTGFAIADLAAGRAGILREGSHLLVVAGLALLWLTDRDLRPRRARRVETPDAESRVDLGDLADDRPAARPVSRQRRGLRPAGRRVA